MNLDSILEHVGAVFLIAVFVLLVYALALRESRKIQTRRAALEALNGQIEALGQKISIATTPDVPGKRVAKELGAVTAEGVAGAGFHLVAEKMALVNLMQRALIMGADAVVNVRHEGHIPGKTRWQRGGVTLVGTAVKLAQ